jgi:hypothetical protein
MALMRTINTMINNVNVIAGLGDKLTPPPASRRRPANGPGIVSIPRSPCMFKRGLLRQTIVVKQVMAWQDDAAP